MADGAAVVDFGSTMYGVPVSRTFTVRNVGGADLTLSESISLPTGFTLVAGFGSTTLAPDQLTTFTIGVDVASLGDHTGEISFGNNDDDEGPFNFTVHGIVEAPDAVQIVDNGDASFAAVGSWTRWVGQGYQDDVHEGLPGTGAGVASWTFTNLLPGNYQVSATWTTYANRATNAPFELLDGNTTRATVAVNQLVAPNDFSDDGAEWEVLDWATRVDTGTLVVRLSDEANGRLNADAIRIERLADAPEIEVSLDDARLFDGTSTIDFGVTPPDVTVTRSLTIENVGTQTLTFDQPISLPDGFSLPTGFSVTTLQPGESTTLTIRFDAIDYGTTTGVVAIGNNDSDENPFNLTVTGLVQDPPPVQIVDNGDNGFSAVGQWTQWEGQGFGNDIHESLPGTGSDVATWTFSGLLPGEYRVAATWTSYSNRATNAPFTILDGTTELATVEVNQRAAPVGFSDEGATWQFLGPIHTIAGNTLVVQLTDDANGRLNADAIRIERVSPRLSSHKAQRHWWMDRVLLIWAPRRLTRRPR